MKKLCGVTMAGVLLAGGAALAAKPSAAREVSGVVNLNTASATELELLPGVGKHTAGLIIAYREKQPFKAAGEVVRVKGVGKGIYRRIKDHLSVSGSTTLAAVRPAKVEVKASMGRGQGVAGRPGR